MTEPLHTRTPLLHSQHLSRLLESDVYLKLENLQPSQSFKYRGISLIVQQSRDKSPDAHIYIASGGNAGLAAACAANAVGIRCTVFLPAGSSNRLLDSLKQSGAEVVAVGQDYHEAFVKCQEAVSKDEKSIMVSAYGLSFCHRMERSFISEMQDDNVLWRGHATIIEEIATDLNVKPSAILCSVGGGGLLAGVMLGCRMVGWDGVPLIALETIGADCFYQSMQANNMLNISDAKLPGLSPGVTVSRDSRHDVALARLPGITSRASSLGATHPAPGAVSMALRREGDVRCVRVPDALSMQAALSFAEDHKFLVELACSTTLVPAYERALFEHIIPPREDGKRRVVVFVVCGGIKISLEEMAEYRAVVDSQRGTWKVWCDGKELDI